MGQWFRPRGMKGIKPQEKELLWRDITSVLSGILLVILLDDKEQAGREEPLVNVNFLQNKRKYYERRAKSSVDILFVC